jgi:predicted exporter
VTERRSLLLGLALIAILLAVCASRFELASDIRHFLPEGEDLRLARVSRLLADSEQARTLVVTVGGEDRADALRRGQALEVALAADPEVASVVGGLDPARAGALEAGLFPHRHGLVDLDLSPEALDRRADALRTELLLPQDPIARRRLLADPLGAWRAFLLRLREGEGRGLSLDGDRFLGRGGERAVLLLRTVHSPFEFDHQEPFLRRLAGLDDRIDRAGAHPYAVEAEASIRGSVRRIALLSTLGVVALFLGAFRSPRSLLLVFLPAGVGVLAGLATVLLVGGRIHGLTLAFGASLVGVCVDYPVHVLGHQRLVGGTARGALRAVLPGLLLGAGTTVAGFAGLMATDFPGIREIAIFAGAGVSAALLATVLLVPPLAARAAPAAGPALTAALDRALALVQRRSVSAAVVGSALLVVLVGGPRLRWEDSLSALSALDPHLQAEEDRARTEVARWDAGRFVVLFGEDLPSALDAAEGVARALDAAVAAGTLGGWNGPTRVLPGPGTQAARQAAVAGAEPAFLDALGARGVQPRAFAGFSAAPPPLDRPGLVAAGLDELLAPFVVLLPEGVALLHFLEGAQAPPPLPAEATWFDQAAFLDGIYGAYRKRTTALLGAGLLVVFGVLLLRYRRPAVAAAAFLPALLAAAAALSSLALFGVRPNLLHLASCLLVLSIGVDYGVFLVEQRAHPEGLRAALPSVAVAAGTTALSFGTLAASPQPALRAIGSVAGLGVFAAVFLAPACLALFAPTTAELETDP